MSLQVECPGCAKRYAVAEKFAGKNAKCTEFDMVLFSGHSSQNGPWLGSVADQANMVPANYHWSSGKTKWFINAGCMGLFDKQTNPGEKAKMEELLHWNQAMGHTPATPSRLHALIGFRSLGYTTTDIHYKDRFVSGSITGRYTANAHRVFMHLLMIEDKAKAENQKPVKMGDTWFFAAAFQWKTFGAEATGISSVAAPHFSTDGTAYAYIYVRLSSQAYVVTGLK